MGFSSKLKLFSFAWLIFVCNDLCFTLTHDLLMQLTVEMDTEQFERMLFVSWYRLPWYRLVMIKLSFWCIDFCNYWIGHLDYPIKWKSSRQVLKLLHNACTYGVLAEDSILNRHKSYRQTVEPEERLCRLKKNGPQIIYYKLTVNLPWYRNLNNQITFVLSYTVSYIK